MNSPADPSADADIAILMPLGGDAAAIAKILLEAKIPRTCYEGFADFHRGNRKNSIIALCTPEAFKANANDGLQRILTDNAFDDLSFIIFAERGTQVDATRKLLSNTLRGRLFQVVARPVQPDDIVRWCRDGLDLVARLRRLRTTVGDLELKFGESQSRNVALTEELALISETAAELHHRIKNVFATVISIGSTASRHADSSEELWQSLDRRLRALAAAHTLLANSPGDAVELTDLLATLTKPYTSDEGPTVAFDGPPVMLRSNTLLILCLALHELVTNAAKYGALSVVAGKLVVNWQCNRDQVDLKWNEHNGPATKDPEESGFGTGLIIRSIEYSLDGTANFTYLPHGMQCELSFQNH